MFTMRRQFNPVVWRRSFGSVARRYQAQPAVSKIKPLEATVASGNGQNIDAPEMSKGRWNLRSLRFYEASPELAVEHTANASPLWLRDACSCSLCVDSSTKQKKFQTSDIPINVTAENMHTENGQTKVTWKNDIPGFPQPHESVYSADLLHKRRNKSVEFIAKEGLGNKRMTVTWNRAVMDDKIKFIDYQHYISSDMGIWEALCQLHIYGLVFLRGVPDSEKAVESIAERIGNLRDTFYGRTWDVKSVPEAKNVAYTNRFLGFHMDLLYMNEPPGIQLLHCLRNTCEGGSSMFSDSFGAVNHILENDDKHGTFKSLLTRMNQVFHYKNAGEHYRYRRPMVDLKSSATPLEIEFVNWSPPFQGPFDGIWRNESLQDWVKIAKVFQNIVEAPENIYEYRMEVGDCVLFNNRRVLHARRAFDTTSGDRWLKGAYVDTDVFMSRSRVLYEKFGSNKTDNQ